jgi:hypothetical protein
MTVWVYVDTSKQVGDKDHLKVFASNDSAEAWLEKNDPEGVAFEYELQNESDLASVPELTSNADTCEFSCDRFR